MWITKVTTQLYISSKRVLFTNVLLHTFFKSNKDGNIKKTKVILIEVPEYLKELIKIGESMPEF